MSLITDQAAFDSLCERIRAAGRVAFDTEFVSEFFFRPRLCLMQFALPGESERRALPGENERRALPGESERRALPGESERRALPDGTAPHEAAEVVCVDPFSVPDLSGWWQLMTDAETEIVVHGGREEIRFCQFATGRRPQNLVDVQVAEGLRSRGFPISHANLVSRVLGRAILHGKETRTDWQHRPLTEQQLRYAQEDVAHLLRVWDKQRESLRDAGRLDWALTEFERLIDGVLAEEDREGWTRLPGYGRLSRRDMAVARELYLWRNREAERLNRPQRRILRDDLLVELAKRQPKSVRELNMTRDMNRRDYQQYAETMIEVIAAASTLPDDQWPQKYAGAQQPAQDEVLARILGLALANRCQELGLSMTLVATGADLKDFVRWRVFEDAEGPTPRLMQGWRAEVCGQLLGDVLNGDVTLRVTDPRSEYPLSFVRNGDGEAVDGAAGKISTARRAKK